MGLIVMSCNVKLPTNKIIELEDKDTKAIVNCLVIREATELEYLNDFPEEPQLTGIYYLMSVD